MEAMNQVVVNVKPMLILAYVIVTVTGILAWSLGSRK